MKKYFKHFVVSLVLIATMAFPACAFASGHTSEPRLSDYAGVLTSDQQDEVETMLDEISEKHKVDVVVVTDTTLDGADLQDTADIYYEICEYGYGKGHDGIMLLILSEDRNYAITTEGFGITAFTDAGLDYLTEQFTPPLGDDDYYTAITTFAEKSDMMIEEAINGEPYDVGHMPKERPPVLWILYCILGGFGVSFAFATIKKSKMTSVVAQQSASAYADTGSMDVTYDHDRFVSVFTTTRVIEDDDDGGSSTHSSSSGTTHGGTTGSF